MVVGGLLAGSSDEWHEVLVARRLPAKGAGDVILEEVRDAGREERFGADHRRSPLVPGSAPGEASANTATGQARCKSR